MKDLFQRMRMAVYVSAVLTILSGIVLIAWPLAVTGFICRVFGVLLVIMGAVYLFGYFMEGKHMLSVAGGLLFVLLGVWIFSRPSSIARLVPIGIGVVMLVHSLKDFQMAAEAKRCKSERWVLMFLLALVNCAFGIICICDSFDVISVAVRVLGIALVYDGISDIIIVYHTVKAVKNAAEIYEPIDVESHEIDV